MVDGYLVTALLFWGVYWVFALVVGQSAVNIPGEMEGFVVSWGWALAPLVLAAGAVHGLVRIVVLSAQRLDLHPGDHVVYNMPKQSVHPGPRARQIYAHACGEGYSYVVPKLWTVVERQQDGSVTVVTPRGKHHLIPRGDPHAHKVGAFGQLLWELRLHKHFPSQKEAAA